ncbi:MAG: type II toxin-antitoxin system RelE/ParE family toxin [Verrucomicrobiota bacterium]|jgi:mRNA interferase RelE/StbE
MPYRVEIGSKADGQLAELDAAIGGSVERRIQWLAENAAVMVHRRLVGMPKDLAGLCKLRVGDYRILYWNYPARKLVRIYRIQHRSEVYRRL